MSLIILGSTEIVSEFDVNLSDFASKLLAEFGGRSKVASFRFRILREFPRDRRITKRGNSVGCCWSLNCGAARQPKPHISHVYQERIPLDEADE